MKTLKVKGTKNINYKEVGDLKPGTIFTDFFNYTFLRIDDSEIWDSNSEAVYAICLSEEYRVITSENVPVNQIITKIEQLDFLD